MLDQLTPEEQAMIETKYKSITVDASYTPTRRESIMGITLFEGNRIAHGVPRETDFVLISVEDLG